MVSCLVRIRSGYCPDSYRKGALVRGRERMVFLYRLQSGSPQLLLICKARTIRRYFFSDNRTIGSGNPVHNSCNERHAGVDLLPLAESHSYDRWLPSSQASGTVADARFSFYSIIVGGH